MGSFIPRASLSEGCFLLRTALSARVLFVECFYFSPMYLANRLVGGSSLGSARLLARSGSASLDSFIEASAQPCWIPVLCSQRGSLPGATTVTKAEGSGMAELVGAAWGASQQNSTSLE